MQDPERPTELPTGAGGTSRIERAAANFGLAVAGTLALLCALELGARIWDRAASGAPVVQPDPIDALYLPHPYLPIVLKPSSDYRDNDTAGHINALGLRGPETSMAKPAGTYRVLCVGGSTTFGAGIIGDENTYPARLEAHLRAAQPGRAIEVLNAGVPGYTTAENLIYLGLRLADLRPDVVVLYEGYNDFKPNRYPGFRSDYAHWRDRAVVPQRRLLERSRLYVKMRSLVSGIVPEANAQVRDPKSGQTMPRYDTVGPEGLEAFRRNLREMIAMSRSDGAQVVLATYAHPCTEQNLRLHPLLLQYLPGYLPNLTFAGVIEAFARYNEAIREVAREQKTPLADAAEVIPPDPDLFVDHVHFNAKGADRFAEVVASAILPSLGSR